LDTTLMRRAKPPLEQGRDEVNVREVLAHTFRVALDGSNAVDESGGLHAVVSVPVVRMHFGALGNAVAQETEQAVAGSVRDIPQANATHFLALQFDGDYHQRLADQLTTATPGSSPPT